MLEEADKEWIAARYVAKEACQERQKANDRKFANDDKRLAVIETFQRIQTWLLVAIGGGIVGILVKLFVGGGV